MYTAFFFYLENSFKEFQSVPRCFRGVTEAFKEFQERCGAFQQISAAFQRLQELSMGFKGVPRDSRRVSGILGSFRDVLEVSISFRSVLGFFFMRLKWRSKGLHERFRGIKEYQRNFRRTFRGTSVAVQRLQKYCSGISSKGVPTC